MTRPINSFRGALMVWMAAFIFFLLTLANNFSAAHDSIHYLTGIVRGEHLFHQHHLLYHFLAHGWLQIGKLVFHSTPDHYIIETFSALWGSSTLAACYLFFRNRFFLTPFIAAAGVSIIGFSYGMWFYSVNIEVYAPPLFFIISTLYVITRKDPVQQDIWLIAILQSMAILFHQVNVLFIIIVFYWIYANRKRFSSLNALARYASTGLLLTGGVYVLIGWGIEGHNSSVEFSEWLLGYTVGHDYWQPISWKTPLSVLAGISRAFFGGHFLFRHPSLDEFVQDSFRSHGLRDEIFLARNISVVFTWVLTILTLVIGILLCVLAVRFVKHFSKMYMHYNVLKPMLLCILVYSAFFFFWMPEILEFWILQMVLTWLILIGMIPVTRFPFKMSLRSGLVFIALSMLIINYQGSIRWLNDKNSDWYHSEIKKLDPSLDAEDIVIVKDEWILKDYARYFTKATVIATDEKTYNENEIGLMVDNAVSKKNKVYLYEGNTKSNDNPWTLIRSY